MDSNTAQSTIAIVLGIIATAIGGFTVYQAERTWRLSRQDQDREGRRLRLMLKDSHS